ncbi:MAG: FeoA family protein [Pirellulaceae bacterium]
MPDLIPLELLPIGHRAYVDQFVGDDANVHRLHEMGLRHGIIVEMVQPGSPCIVKLMGNKLCIRDANLFQVLVRPGAVE